MKKLLLILLLCLTAPAWATAYFISPSGSDGNNGTSTGTPWLSPNHALNCGDTITAAAGTYAAANFVTGKWGTVTCAAGNNVAWLQCATFDACKISDPSDTTYLATMWVDKSYWGVQGWEVTNGTSTYAACFGVFRNTVTPVQIHHVIFANNVANGCGLAGFGAANEGNLFGVDYLVIIGNIAYNATQGNGECGSGISIFQPVASDSLPGTHLYIAGNFSFDNVDANPCNSGTPTDGEGVILDALSGVDTAGLPAYNQQTVVANNILIYNGQAGAQTNGSTSAPTWFVNNTFYGNFTDSHISSGTCGQLLIASFSSTTNLVQSSGNLSYSATSESGCASSTPYAYFGYEINGTDHVFANYAYNASANNYGCTTCTGFSYGPNNVNPGDPSFASPANPGAPSCGSATSVPACMAAVIANFTPTTAAASYGYQPVSTTSHYDPLYPQWLCSVTNLPTGLVTPGCVIGRRQQ